MEFLYCFLIGYFIGVINPSYFIAKIRGFDIRQKGSGNAGASNALILFGKALGIFCAIFDIAKAYLAILLTTKLFKDFELAFVITSLSCIIGHIFPFYMKFKGGKGLACLGGTVLFFDWRVFLVMLAFEAVIVLVTDYICFVPLTASASFPIVYLLMRKDIIGTLLLFILFFIMIYKHMENLKRIKLGKEMRFSFLWNKEKELERIKNNLDEDTSNFDEHFSGKSKN